MKSYREEIALSILNGMISSAPMTDRLKVDKALWVKIAFIWADEFLKQMRDDND